MKLLAFFLIVFTAGVVGQTPDVVERELLGHLENIAKHGTYGGEYNEEKLNEENRLLKDKLIRNAVRPEILKYSFPKLKDEMSIATSKDGKLRVYSWDLQSGGTMHDYDRVIQYLGRSGKTMAWSNDEENEGGGALYTDVFQVNDVGGPIYLLVSASRASTSLNGQSISVARIDGDNLDLKSKLIRTASGLQNSIAFAYDFFSVVDRPERPVKLVSFDATRREFKFPVVIEDEKTPQGRVTNKSITYRFDGKAFVKISK